jgi:hypothetical protein
MSNMFALDFGLVPEAHVADAWNVVTQWGLEQIGDFGAFWFQMAVASGYYANYYPTPSSDDGSDMVTALAKCDQYSWCSGLRDDNLTMTRESWHDGTYSHGWGTSALVGVSWGIAGIHVTEPGWAAFIVKPKLGPLQTITIRTPTIRGYINVTATPLALDVAVPCNARATLCAPRSASDGGALTAATHALLLNGEEVDAPLESGGHLCLPAEVGCGAAGAEWRLRAVPHRRAGGVRGA